MSSPSSGGTSSIDTSETGAATRQARSDASNSVIARVPLQPRLTCCQKRSRPTPNGETTPMPVTTTRIDAYSIQKTCMNSLERLFVWGGGGMFVGSLALTVWWYAVRFAADRAVTGWTPIAIDALLVTIFAAHHSAFAREP